jgi:DNA-binding NarL/FixJ family response regulator
MRTEAGARAKGKHGGSKYETGKPPKGAPRRPSITVVLADDHTVVRAGIRRILETAPDIRVVAEAKDGTQAMQAISKSRPDVAVLDLKMPEAGGIEVTRWARQNSPSTAILILSAFDDDPYVLAALEAGANGYVLKNADTDDIVSAVRTVNQSKPALDPDIAKKVLKRLSDRGKEKAPERLTGRESEILVLVAKGWTNKAIGSELGISYRTVQGHLAKIFDKLDCESRTEAVMRAISLGWLPDALGFR